MKVAAIWWRTSTKAQLEISPETQVQEARKALQAKGYRVLEGYILGSDWTSMDLLSCPPFQQLRLLVGDGHIQAIGILDRDRLQAQGLQRLMFLADCKQNDVELIVAQGPAFVDGPEGQIVELALAVGKERSNLRAQMGSKLGLRDRVQVRGLPITRRAPYGYSFNNEMNTLLPNEDWSTLHRILTWVLEGVTLRRISRWLYGAGVPSPGGKLTWPINTLSKMAQNPTYAGRYYALKTESVEPAHRKGTTYGKSSQVKKPQDQWHYVPSITIADPPITWDQLQELKERLARNQRFSARNTRRQYLLRGLILCEVHNRSFHGRPHHNQWDYRCPSASGSGWGIERCSQYRVNGPRLEESVWEQVSKLLSNPTVVDQELASERGAISQTEQALLESRNNVDRKRHRTFEHEAHYARLSAEGKLSPEAHAMLKGEINAQRAWCDEESKRIQNGLGALKARAEATVELVALAQRIHGKLETTSFDEKRMVLEALDAQIRVNGDSLKLLLHIPTATATALTTPGHG